jgi:hypothetical protein
MPAKRNSPCPAVACTCEVCGRPFMLPMAEIRKGRGHHCSKPCSASRPRNNPGKPLEDRLWPKIDQHGPLPDVRPDLGACWIWTGHTVRGYGVVWSGPPLRKSLRVHNVVYEALVGSIPDGYENDHLCRVRQCCRPTHLEPVPPRINKLRGESPAAKHAARTHCANGHPFDQANTGLRGDGKGRVCRTCQRVWQRRDDIKRGPR